MSSSPQQGLLISVCLCKGHLWLWLKALFAGCWCGYITMSALKSPVLSALKPETCSAEMFKILIPYSHSLNLMSLNMNGCHILASLYDRLWRLNSLGILWQIYVAYVFEYSLFWSLFLLVCLQRSLFSWKPKESRATASQSAPGWKLFGKIPLRDNPPKDSRTIQEVREAV